MLWKVSFAEFFGQIKSLFLHGVPQLKKAANSQLEKKFGQSIELRLKKTHNCAIRKRESGNQNSIELYLFQINMTKKPGWSFHVRPYKVKQFSMGASFCYAFTYYQFHLTWLCFGHPMIHDNVLMDSICFCGETYSVEATPFCDDTWYHKIISIM